SRDHVGRREFLKTASAAGLGVMMTNLPETVRATAAASERVVVAVVGLNGRGLVHAQNFMRLKNAEVAYLCDVDSAVLGKAVRQTSELQQRAPTAIGDFRRALDDPQVDAISIATPDHWHAPMAILAM